MQIIKTHFKDLILIKNKNFYDSRGFFREVFKKKIIKNNFVFDCMSTSKKNVLRGLHYQEKFPQGKLLTVLSGKIFDVAVDLRKKSKTFGKYFSITIDANSGISIFIPPNFAHGFLCLSDECNIYYKCTNYRHEKSEKTILFKDKKLGIKWPKRKYILSKKDQLGLNFNDLTK